MNQKVTILSAPKRIQVWVKDETVDLPLPIQEQIDHYWNTVNRDQERFTRGTIYTVSRMESNPDFLNVELVKTDYAHYLYTNRKSLPEAYACQVIYSAVMLVTQDEQVLIGEMGTDTAHPGRLQFPGGSVDPRDVYGNRVDLRESVIRECREEIGFDLKNRQLVGSFDPKYVKLGGPFRSIAVIYKANLRLTSRELQELYAKHVQSLLSAGETPEFTSLTFVSTDPEAVRKFCREDQREKVDYLEPVLRTDAGIL
ncbi:NUDIX domain-containing protein [Lihuaxuella thermophila]|uniref:NUDIX domain-containing protein n=1 Tax=Lihuaxuella thermophila TaxID=1173111 RepID=A0A1H8D8M7_9BACL|nr:NUDIX domain-containing protein [Lihuaxuella thermophila]SEN03516.1 NUDIX domain-containing protein [Lihuaxuella thermophila]